MKPGMYLVIFRDDTKPDGTKGDFVLSSKTFEREDHAYTYARSINESREPKVVCVLDSAPHFFPPLTLLD